MQDLIHKWKQRQGQVMIAVAGGEAATCQMLHATQTYKICWEKLFQNKEYNNGV